MGATMNTGDQSCSICGSDIGPSESGYWHYASEDCRAIRQPILSMNLSKRLQAVADGALTAAPTVRLWCGDASKAIDADRALIVELKSALQLIANDDRFPDGDGLRAIALSALAKADNA